MQAKSNSEHEKNLIVATRALRPMTVFMAFFMVAIMVIAAFVILAPAGRAPDKAPAADIPARTQATDHWVNYTISNIGESYMKDERDVDGGRGLHNTTLGLSEWWTKRGTTYSDTIVHNAYPYAVAYNSESGLNTYTGSVTDPVYPVNHLKFGTYGFYRFTIDAKHLPNVASGPSLDPLYVPVLGSLASNGGTVHLNWHLTYLTSYDVAAIYAGTHYANTYYGVPARGGPADTGASANDGWYVEHAGTMDFDREAAKKFLGLPGTGNLGDEFNASNTAPHYNMNKAWENHIQTEGNGQFAIYACYDWTINSGGGGPFYLTVDPRTTADKLVLRMWGYTWGGEYLQLRWLDSQGLVPDFVAYTPEDWYFNATITPTYSDVFSRMSAAYHMIAWKDAGYFSAAWLIDSAHVDYNNALYGTWFSRFYLYQAQPDWTPVTTAWSPGSNNYSEKVAYWNTPRNWNLAEGEKLDVKLSNRFMGIVPYKGIVDDSFPAVGGNPAKAAELNQHKVWGEMTLGHGFPSSLYSANYYNHTTKTLSIVGPTAFPRNPNPRSDLGYDILNGTGSPQIMLDVSRISNYVMTLPAGAHNLSTPYTLTVTAKNYTGDVLNGANPNGAWNGTVDLTASAGVTFGATQHKWSVSDNGVWTTTVTFTTAGVKSIRAVDLNNSLDVDDTLSVTASFDIPLVKGWNFVSVPLIGGGYTANSLGLLAGDLVSGWNPTTQRYDQNYIVGAPRNNFPINTTSGYWIYANAVETISLKVGAAPTSGDSRAITVPATGGWVIIGFNSFASGRVAENVGAMYTGGSVLSVVKYVPTTGAYISHIIPSTRNNFALVPGEAYWIWVTASGTLSYSP